MEAILKNPEHPEYGTAAIPVPFSIVAEEYEESMRQLASMGIGDPLARDCAVEGVTDAPPVLERLKGHRVNVDELDYLSRRLDGFDGNEIMKFSAMAHIMGLTAAKDLINLTFCSSEVTVIRNFNNLASEGETHFLTVKGGASLEELKEIDPVKIISDLIAGGKGVVTPYGVAYHNGMVFQELYKGGNFPEYHCVPEILFGKLSKSRQPENWEEIVPLYFPMGDSALTRALVRAGLEKSGEPLYLELESADAPLEVEQALGAERTVRVRDGVLEELNAMSRAIAKLPDSEYGKLGEVIRFAEPRDAAQIQRLAENLDLFEFIPDEGTPEEQERELTATENGGFTAYGYVVYHGELPLDELMSDNASEAAGETAIKRLSTAEKGVPRRTGAER